MVECNHLFDKKFRKYIKAGTESRLILKYSAFPAIIHPSIIFRGAL